MGRSDGQDLFYVFLNHHLQHDSVIQDHCYEQKWYILSPTRKNFNKIRNFQPKFGTNFSLQAPSSIKKNNPPPSLMPLSTTFTLACMSFVVVSICFQVWKCTIQGVLDLLPKNQHVLCAISKLSTPFWKVIYAPYSKLSEKLRNSTKILVGQAVLESLIQTTFWLFWSIT